MPSVHLISVINHTEALDAIYKSTWQKFSPHTSIMPSSPQEFVIRRTLSGAKVRLFAVLIGIDTYPVANFNSLRGAVADANEVKDYLETYLGVPSDQINLLTEKQATRSAIVGALQDLRDDERIDKGDAIVIYYAGHGTEMDAPDRWKALGADKIQAIVPYDCDTHNTATGEQIRAIPDFTIEFLLSRIAEKNGDNITVIFDCCHSASGTRGGPDPNVGVRSATLASSECPADLDFDIMDTGTRGVHAASKYRTRGLGSHILLAACGSNELAKEDSGRGRFTSSLLALLRRVSPEDLHYADILGHPMLPIIHDQNPQLEGLNLNRALFDAKVLPSQRKSFTVRYDTTRNCYTVGAGTIDRIRQSTKFELYLKSDITHSNPLGVLIADKVMAFSTMAYRPDGGPKISLEQPTIAIVIPLGDTENLRMEIPANNAFRDIWNDLRKSKSDLNDIGVVEGPKAPAHIVAQLIDTGEVAFTINIDHQQSGLPKELKTAVHLVNNDPIDLHRVLSAAAHYFGEFENRRDGTDVGLLKNIDIQFRQLEYQESPDLFEQILNPIGRNLFREGVINVCAGDGSGETQEEIPYGLSITNNSGEDMYVNIFQFNPNQLQISSIAKPHNSNHDYAVDVPLTKLGGSLTVGYGKDGYSAMAFELPTGKDAEVVFLKIYLTSQSINLSYLEQTTPFLAPRGMKQFKPPPRAFWTDVTIPVIQWRKLPPTVASYVKN